ncbi:MAG: hypothetical protein GC185_11740 [Alphaproteobacteria bacterium]|nr:hypothetical protein [Alphaproteobacteria bacterium]
MQQTATQTAGSAPVTGAAAGGGWLYNRPFDLFLIFGPVLLGLAAGATWFTTQAVFITVLTINLWTLGYHHVIATYTRLCFDKASFRRSWWMIFLLMPVVLGGVIWLAKYAGLWVIATIYLYAQWFHYSRQSWGISRAYERNAPHGYVADRSWQTQAAFYSFPVWGILYRSWQHPHTFLTMPIKVLPVTHDLVILTGMICVSLFGIWLARVYSDWRKGVLPVAYTCFMLSHFATFTVAYILMPNLDSGWIIVNVWHNLQYIMFVWLFNNRNYRAGVNPKAKLLSFLSQTRHAALYFLTTLALTFIVYKGVRLSVASSSADKALMVAAVIYMTINFHHYIVDAIIWRMSWIRRGREAAAPVAASEVKA